MLQRHGGKCDTLCRIFGSVGASKRAVAASSGRALRERSRNRGAGASVGRDHAPHLG
jgi:hypothetical protein